MAKKVVISKKPTVKNIKDTETFGQYIKYKRTTAGLSTALYVAKMFGLKIGIMSSI